MTEHVWFKCEQPCEKQHCVYCDGGLSYCVVCRKGEVELEPTCPGAPVVSLEFSLRKLRDNIDMLTHALSVNRNGGYGYHLIRPSMGRVKPWWKK